MRTEATVIAVTDKIATVTINRKSACDGCHKSEDGKGCSVCSLLGADRAFTARAKNEIGAKVGDRVEVETESRRVLLYAMLVFLLPLVLALVCYLIAAALTESLQWQLLSALAGFAGTFLGVWIYSERVRRDQQDIVVVEILKETVGKTITE